MKRVFLSIVALMCLTMVQAQPRAFQVRSNIPTDSIRLSDPAILADQKTKMYYMTGTGGSGLLALRALISHFLRKILC